MKVLYTMMVCDCCAIAESGGDVSGCEFYHDDHHERLCEFGTEPGEHVVPGDEVDPIMTQCAGCGDDEVCSHTVSVLVRA